MQRSIPLRIDVVDRLRTLPLLRRPLSVGQRAVEALAGLPVAVAMAMATAVAVAMAVVVAGMVVVIDAGVNITYAGMWCRTGVSLAAGQQGRPKGCWDRVVLATN